jgi:hypothetical protein
LFILGIAPNRFQYCERNGMFRGEEHFNTGISRCHACGAFHAFTEMGSQNKYQ